MGNLLCDADGCPVVSFGQSEMPVTKCFGCRWQEATSVAALDGLLMFLQSCPCRMLDVEGEGDLPSRSQLCCLSNVRRRPILAPCRDAAVASSLPGPVYCVLWRYAAGAECLCDEVGSIRWALGQSALAAVDCDDAS